MDKTSSLPNGHMNPKLRPISLLFLHWMLGKWSGEYLHKKSVCPDDTFQGDRRCGLESPQLGTSSEYGFLTSCVTAPVIKVLYKRGCSSWGFTLVLEKETVSFTWVLERVFADAYWVAKVGPTPNSLNSVEPTLRGLPSHGVWGTKR